MTSYPTTLPKPTLSSSGSQEPTGFDRSRFDFYVRQRKSNKEYVKSGFAIVIPFYLIDEFKAFWGTDSVEDGAPFFCDWLIHGSDNVDKIVRFSNAYKIEPLGNLLYRISAPIEILDFGASKSAQCPSYPYNTSYPSNTRYPC